MSLPLGSPVQRTPITIIDVAQAITLPHGIMSIQIQNTGNSDCYVGNASVTSANGLILYSQGDRMTFETLPSNFKLYLICESGKTTTVRILDFL